MSAEGSKTQIQAKMVFIIIIIQFMNVLGSQIANTKRARSIKYNAIFMRYLFIKQLLQ